MVIRIIPLGKVDISDMCFNNSNKTAFSFNVDHLLMRATVCFRSRDKDGGQPVRSAHN